jgi:hypothetical protein
MRKRLLESTVLKYAEVHVVITYPYSWYVCNVRVCVHDLSWQVVYTEHKEYVAVRIIMTYADSYLESVREIANPE